MTRRYELDLCRILACLMVVMIHLSGSGWHIDPASGAWRVYNLVHTAVRAGIPLFFMISGALFLEREELDLGRLVRRNLVRLLAVYLCWDLLYELVTQAVSAPYHSVGEFLAGMTYGHYHLWFLPAMLTIYLVLPILHGALHGRAVSIPFLLAVFGLIFLKGTLLLLPDPPPGPDPGAGQAGPEQSEIPRLCPAGLVAVPAAVGAPGPVGMRGGLSGLRRPHGLWQPAALPGLRGAHGVVQRLLRATHPAGLLLCVLLLSHLPWAGALRRTGPHHSGAVRLHPRGLPPPPLCAGEPGADGVSVNNYSPFAGLPLLFFLIAVPSFLAVFLLRRIPGLRLIV